MSNNNDNYLNPYVSKAFLKMVKENKARGELISGDDLDPAKIVKPPFKPSALFEKLA